MLRSLQSTLATVCDELAGYSNEQNSISEEKIVDVCQPTAQKEELQRLTKEYNQLSVSLEEQCDNQVELFLLKRSMKK